ncbi:MAG TPA: anthranilate synthase component I [Chloroflexota bacterium]|nr:anthranilate synthase component I [Chloroflexota bacterium]
MSRAAPAEASCYPTWEAVRDLPESRGTVSIQRDILADLDTPVSAFLKVREGGLSFLLESVEGGERAGRFSFIGNGSWRWELGRERPEQPQPAVGGITPSAFVPLRDRLDAMRSVLPSTDTRFDGGAIGYLGYEAVGYAEKVPAAGNDILGLPDGVFMGVDTLLVFDHLQHTIRIISHMPLNEPRGAAYRQAVERIDAIAGKLHRAVPADAYAAAPTTGVTGIAQPRSNIAPGEFAAMVLKAKEYIRAGDIYQVVLSQRLSIPLQSEPFTLYRALRTVSPSPYMYFLDFGDHQVVGASPELLVQVEDGVMTTRPIAGTRHRGRDEEEDQALGRELLADEKERAEHIMLVDLARNDLGRVSAPGTVEVGKLMEVERFSHVMHIVSDVTGSLRSDRTPDDALWATFPAGTLSGAPKIRAMEIIAELERDRRGPYGGAVGFLTPSGDLEFAITIRTAVIKDGMVHVQSGAGIVADSIPEREYEETMNKARAMLLAARASQRFRAS